MPHSYPLHTSVLAECLCCHSRQRFEFASASDQVVCAACTRHLGLEKAVQRDAAHVALWAALLRHSEESAAFDREAAALAAAAGATESAVLTARVAELVDITATSFDAGGGTRELLETEILARIERRARLEARSADTVFSALVRLAALHGGEGTACSCGTPICPGRAIIDPVRRRLADWEAKQLAALAAGERHALPSDHPALQAPPR